jgi:hypothetical protein
MDFIEHVIAVLGEAVFFEIILVTGLSRLSRTCQKFRHLQCRKDALLPAIVGSTRARMHLEYRLALFGMMPRAIVHGSKSSIGLIRIARAYERNLVPNRRLTFPLFYAYAYYWGICGSSDFTRRRQVWKEIAAILCEMLEQGHDIGHEPWARENATRRHRNARHFMLLMPKNLNS